MSLYVLAADSLIADPARRTGATGEYATATVRTAADVSVIAFGGAAAELLEHRQGDAVAVPDRARLTSWTGRDGAEHHGLSLVAEQVTSAAAARRADADRRRKRDAV